MNGCPNWDNGGEEVHSLLVPPKPIPQWSAAVIYDILSAIYTEACLVFLLSEVRDILT